MSSTAPLVGITGRRRPASLMGAPAGFADAPLDVYFAEYATSVAKAGGVPVFIPLDVDIAEILPRLDALVIAGGEDVDPARYGAEPSPETGPCSALRDDLELAAVRIAHERGMPVLGVCRGHQVINVAFGGTLVQHLEGDLGPVHMTVLAPRAERTHDVRLAPGSVPAAVLGTTELAVNSYHHQAVGEPGDGIRVVAWAADGTPEAIQHAGGRIVGVQWHPETFDGDPLFEWVVQTAAGAGSAADEIQEDEDDDQAA